MVNQQNLNNGDLSIINKQLIDIASTEAVVKSIRETLLAATNSNLPEIIKLNLDAYNNFLYDFRKIDFERILLPHKTFSLTAVEEIREILLNATKIGNQLNFDYLRFYRANFDLQTRNFNSSEEKKQAKSFEQKIIQFDEIKEEKFKAIERAAPEILIPFKVSWDSILEGIKKGIENRAMKEFWSNINEQKLNDHPENIGQNIIDGFLHFSEDFLNKNCINFRFSKEDETWARGRVDFIFRFTNPTYEEVPVEIKVITEERDLDNYGELQLLDYMKKRNYKQGIRLVLNATKNHNIKNFERDNIIHFFINIWQPTSSSLN